MSKIKATAILYAHFGSDKSLPTTLSHSLHWESLGPGKEINEKDITGDHSIVFTISEGLAPSKEK